MQIPGPSRRRRLHLDLGAAQNNESVVVIARAARSIRIAATADKTGAGQTNSASQGIRVYVQQSEQVQGIGIKVIRVLELLAAYRVGSAAGLRVDGREAGGADEGGEDGAGEHSAGSSWLLEFESVIVIECWRKMFWSWMHPLFIPGSKRDIMDTCPSS